MTSTQTNSSSSISSTTSSTSRSATTTVTAVADSSGECLAALRPARFTNVAEGRLGVAARPGMKYVNWLATDILTALGARTDVSGGGTPGSSNPLLAATWLRVHGISDLYVQFAWDITFPALRAAVDLAQTAGVHLWLVGDSPYSDYHSEELSPHHAREWTGTQFLDQWRHLTRQPALEPALEPGRDADGEPDGASKTSLVEGGSASEWPSMLPEDDFTSFRASCRDLLPTREFAVVDRAFLAGLHDATTTLAPVLGTIPDRSVQFRSNRSSEDEVEFESKVAGWFAQRWEDAESLQHFQVTLRAAQVAAFNVGYLIQIDLDKFIGLAATTPRRAQRNPATWARLHAYPQPHRGAACALAAAGLTTDPMSRLTVDSYDHARGIVTDEHDRQYLIEPAARVFLLAQQTLRHLEGAADDDLLLLNPSNAKAIAPRALSTAIRRTRRELGAAIALPGPETLPVGANRWMRRWGINVVRLA